MELTEIEAKRQELETNMQNIRKSLKHWQNWDAQYEGLKEELTDLDSEDLDSGVVEGIMKDCRGDLLTENEIRDLVRTPANDNDAATPLRSRRQILGLVERRQEYVQKNIETLQRRYFVAEGKIEEFAFASMTASGVYGDGAGEADDGGLPLTEIHEELDEEGNVVSSELRRPEEHRSKVIEQLKAAGLSAKELGVEEVVGAGVEKGAATVKSALVSPLPSPTKLVDLGSESAMLSGGSDGEHETPIRPPIRKKSVSFSADTKLAEEKPQPEVHEGRKSVSFAEKVAIARAADPPDTRSVTFSPQVEEIPPQPLGPPSPVVHPTAVMAPDATPTAVNADLSRQADLRASFKPGEKVYEIDADTETTKPHIVLPANESEEDARVRQEMLSYHLNEVNNVVAQMDIDDEYDEDDDDDDDTHEDGRSVFTASENQDDHASYTSGMSDWETEDEEDEFGRSDAEISDDYRDEMKALQERLIGNMGSAPADEEIKDLDPELDPADVRKLVIRDRRSSLAEPTASSEPEKKSNSKKRVSFAEELDVATEHVKAQKHVEGESALPLSETEVSRPTGTSQATSGATTRAMTSRYKQRLSSPATPADLHAGNDSDEVMTDTHTGPPGIPLAEHLIERAPSSKPISAPDLEQHDAISARRELAADYYRRRNDIIREQGGFRGNAEEEEDLGELMEERGGRVRKVSRFMAARVGR